jgi:hypothetical protein
MDIHEGMFIIDGNQVAAMNADVTAEYITAFDGTADVIVTYDEVLDKTIVKADYVQVKASDPSPDNYASNVCPGEQLSWQAGPYAVDHNVYFGTSLSDVNESADPCLDHYGSTQWTPSGLAPGTKYYWRVDGVDDTDMNSPWVGDIWEFTTNDGNAFDPHPEDTETVVRADTNLRWTPGCTADSHNVYFGTDYNDVRDANDSWPVDESVYKGNQVVGANEYDPCDFDYYTWYYWRVDEVDGGTTYKGKVWSFRSIAETPEPNIILWYKLDESQGIIVSDSSSYEHDGLGYEIGGWWEPNNGHINGCLDFDSNEHVKVPSETLETIDKEITVSVWVKGDDDHADEEGKVFDTGGGDYHMRARIPTDDGDLLWRAGNDTNDSLVWRQASPLAWAEEWHFFAFVKDENAGTMSIYFDGFLEASKDGVSSTLTEVAGTAFRIGADNDEQGDYTGKLDDFRVYDRALSSQKIQEFIRGDLSLAWAPRPYDGRPDVLRDVNLIWNPGDYIQDTNGHEVFFGTDWDDVNDMTEPCSAQDACEYDPGLLQLDTAYYWRVDEVNDPCVWKGPVWRFTVGDFVILDDFEQYNSSTNKVTKIWYAGNGYLPGTPATSGSKLELAFAGQKHPVYGGEQAMKYEYVTDSTFDWEQELNYADACLPLAEIDGFTDWTSVDVRLLTIFFYGQPDNDTNDTEQMYLAVHDTDGNYAEMRYGEHDGEDMNDLKVKEWQKWDVPLVWYTEDSNAAVAADINFASISSVYLGFGDRFNPVAGGFGTVYFDDLRVSMAFCRPEYGPTGDLSGDCFVGVADVGVMSGQWLRSDVNVNPVTEPPTSDPNLVGHWKLDGDANDSSDSGYHGTAKGVYEWTTGKDGNAIDLAGGWVVVDDNGLAPKLRPKHNVSVMAWINRALATRADIKIVIKGGDNRETYGLQLNDDFEGLEFIMHDANALEDGKPKQYEIRGERELRRREWIHIAGTYDGNEMTSYINGEVDGTRTPGPYELYSDPNDGFGIGGRWGDDDEDNRFVGKIDDVRVYDRAVSRAEIAYIASGGDGVISLESEANLLSGEDPEVINFRDYATLFDYWGDKHLWPPEPLP